MVAEMDPMEKILVDICVVSILLYISVQEFIFMCIYMYRSVFFLEVTVC